MKNLILAFCAMFAFATVAVAQAPATAPAPATTAGTKMKEHGKDHAKEMGGKGKAQGQQGKGQMGGNLGLSAEQEASFKAVNKAHQEAMKAVQMDKSLAADAKKAQVEALKSKYEADVKGTMNADQYTKWMAMRAKRDEKKAEMGDHKMEGKAMKGKAKSDKAAAPQGH